MKLHYNNASPFARKVRVVALETGLDDRIELMTCVVSPVAPVQALNADNPLGKIPCLITDDGLSLFDSRVITAYLDHLHQGEPLMPADGLVRWQVKRLEALADGMMDAAVGIRYETALRPQELQWPQWITEQKGKVERALNALNDEVEAVGEQVHIGTIAAAVALGYLDFRFAKDDWRRDRAALADWYQRFAARPSMQATVPS